MITVERITLAGKYVDSLGKCLYKSELQATERIVASASCYAVTLQHHHATVWLIDGNLYASALALLRIMYDAYIRGLWLNLCAEDNEIQKFLENTNWEPPKTSELIKKIEAKLNNNSAQIDENELSDFLSNVKKQKWRVMCDYTHTGGLQIQRWLTPESIEPHYPSEEMEEVLKFAELIGSLAALALATLTNNEQLCYQVSKIKEEHDLALLKLSN
jgi:hypothetical protein